MRQRLTDDTTISRVPLLDPAECLHLVERIDAARDAWRKRGEGFYTLGTATYLDACTAESDERYRSLARQDNRLLAEAFDDLYAKVRAGMSDLVGQRCDYATDLALPGFHIFLATSLNAAMRDHFHLDLQFRHLSLPVTSYSATMTFTLPVELPLAGAGIDFCRLDPSDKRGTVTTELYRLGELLVHSGRTLHRRALLPTTARCRRLTLQGHALRLEGDTWILYW